MTKEFEKCVKKNKLTRFTRGHSVTEKKLNEAFEDLNEAKIGFKSKKYKWATIQAYYAMFNAGNALLMKKGWRERNSHYCLIIGLKELYANTGQIDITFIEAIQKGKVLREAASYHSEWSEENCKEIILNAEKFLNMAQEIVNEGK